MAETTTDTGQTLPEDWRQKLLNLWMQVRLGHEGFMLEKATKAAAINNAMIRGTAKGNFDELANMTDEDMGVSIGNESHTHITKASSGLLPLLATALGGTGIGAAAVMYALQRDLPKGEVVATPPAAQVTDTDTNTEYEFGLGFPE